MLSTDDDDDDDGDDGQKRSRKANPLFSKTKIETILLQLKKMSLRLLSPDIWDKYLLRRTFYFWKKCIDPGKISLKNVLELINFLRKKGKLQDSSE